MIKRQAILGAAIAALLGGFPVQSFAYTPEEQRDCTNDAFRLCGNDIPDEGRVGACMFRQRAQLSPACASHFVVPAEPAATGVPSAAQKPLDLQRPAAKPASLNKAKRKKPAKPARRT